MASSYATYEPFRLLQSFKIWAKKEPTVREHFHIPWAQLKAKFTYLVFVLFYIVYRLGGIPSVRIKFTHYYLSALNDLHYIILM